MASYSKSQSSPTKNTNHSAGGVFGGVATCNCGQPARRLVSHTSRNPDRPFYKCFEEKCGFFKWKDDLPGVVDNEDTQPPRTPQARRTAYLPSTPQSNARHLFVTPESTPAKRNYTHMSTGSKTGPHTQLQRRRALSPGAKARRFAEIEEALSPKRNTPPEQDNDEDRESEVDTVAASVQTDRPLDSEEEEYDEYNGRANDGKVYSNEGGHADSGDGLWQPATKRTRLTVKTEDDSQSTSLRHRHSTPVNILPTPAQSRQRTCSNNDDDGFDAASPTSHTLGGQRAMEKARAKGNGKISSHISEQSRDERSRGKGHRDTDLGVGGHKGEEDEDEDASNETQCTLTNNAAAESSFPKELASLYTQSRAHAQAPTPGPSQDGVAGHMHAASEALAATRSSMDIAEQSMKAIEQELHKLQRKLTASEQSAKAKARRIAKLEEEVAELKERNTDLESFCDTFQNLTQKIMTPTRR